MNHHDAGYFDWSSLDDGIASTYEGALRDGGIASVADGGFGVLSFLDDDGAQSDSGVATICHTENQCLR